MFVRYRLQRGIKVSLVNRHLSRNGSGNNASKSAVNPIVWERGARENAVLYIYMYTYGICIFHIISFRCQLIRIYINEILFYFAKLHADLATTLSKISKENWHQSKRQQNPSSETKHVPVLHCTVAVTCKITLKTGLLAKSGLLFQRVWVQLTDFCFIVPSNRKKGQKRKRRSLFSNAANSISA